MNRVDSHFLAVNQKHRIVNKVSGKSITFIDFNVSDLQGWPVSGSYSVLLNVDVYVIDKSTRLAGW
ncbi:hypothetical protein, partial [Escherichia coli]|uniref:hypothetical protein n=2 Tax=Escherichia coli TaxID=562 RepID=UPI001BD3A457